MKPSFAITVAFVAGFYKVNAAAGAEIETTAVPTSCGQQTCCIPACQLTWTDNNGCSGDAETAGACDEAFVDVSTTSDTGVDICDGAGAFFCTTYSGDKVVYVVNRENTVSAALFPATYTECTLSGQCAPCPEQGSCEAPVTIGTSTSHSCADFAALLQAANVGLATC